jgi:hypothetical protein
LDAAVGAVRGNVAEVLAPQQLLAVSRDRCAHEITPFLVMVV